MASSIWLGNKLRRIRRDAGVTQVALAKDLGISPSYLNMIERNQRPMTLRLLEQTADVFDISPDDLAQDDDARLLVDLMEMFGDPVFRECGVTRDDLRDIVNVTPSAGRALLDFYRVFRSTREDVEWLRERMTDDDFMTTSAYELRSALTPIRSFAEILHDNVDLEPDDQRRFAGILVRESERLAEIIGRMLSLSSGGDQTGMGGLRSPEEQVTDFVQDRLNYFETLESVAEEARQAAGLSEHDSQAGMAERLTAHYGIAVRTMPAEAGQPSLVRFDADSGTLHAVESLSPASRLFQLAKQVGLSAFGDVINDCTGDGVLDGDAAHQLCRRVLAGYFAGAVVMPYTAFLSAAEEGRYDVKRLQDRFQASFEQVCHRLTTLQRPGSTGVPLHFLKVDIAGNICKRFSISGLRIPRYGGVCPRAILHSAFMAPGQISRQIERMPDGSTFFTVARTVSKPAIGGPSSLRHYAVAIGCDIAHAASLAYSDGMDLASDAAIVPVGVTCRVCDRTDCGQRAHPPVLRSVPNEVTAEEPGDA